MASLLLVIGKEDDRRERFFELESSGAYRVFDSESSSSARNLIALTRIPFNVLLCHLSAAGVELVKKLAHEDLPIPDIRICVTDEGAYHPDMIAARNETIKVRAIEEKCFHRVVKWTYFEPGNIESALQELIRNIRDKTDEKLNLAFSYSHDFLNAFLPLHIALQALEGGGEKSEYVDVFKQSEELLNEMPEKISKLIELVPAEDRQQIDPQLRKITTEGKKVCTSLAIGVRVRVERIRQLLGDIETVAGALQKVLTSI